MNFGWKIGIGVGIAAAVVAGLAWALSGAEKPKPSTGGPSQTGPVGQEDNPFHNSLSVQQDTYGVITLLPGDMGVLRIGGRVDPDKVWRPNGTLNITSQNGHVRYIWSSDTAVLMGPWGTGEPGSGPTSYSILPSAQGTTNVTIDWEDVNGTWCRSYIRVIVE